MAGRRHWKGLGRWRGPQRRHHRKTVVLLNAAAKGFRAVLRPLRRPGPRGRTGSWNRSGEVSLECVGTIVSCLLEAEAGCGLLPHTCRSWWSMMRVRLFYFGTAMIWLWG